CSRREYYAECRPRRGAQDGDRELTVDLLDFVILGAAVGYGLGGYRNGAVVGVFSLAGFLGGAVVGAQLGRPLATSIAHGRGQVVVALVSVLMLALIGQLAMV